MMIERITVREIFDSRGEPTIEVAVAESGHVSRAEIPSGRSRGSREATVCSPAEAEGRARGVLQREIVGRSFDSVGALDRALCDLDGTSDKSSLGGNLMLGMSVAHARNLALEARLPLWKVIRDEFFSDTPPAHPPRIFSNLINGGSHANNNLAIQEYLVIIRTAPSVTQAIRDLVSLYRNLGELIKDRYHIRAIPIGDEDGYAIDFRNNFEPLSVLDELVGKAGAAREQMSIGLDVAASGFYREGRYEFGGERLSTEEMGALYARHFASLPALESIEDPFAETDDAGFRALQARFPEKLIVGDDLTVTNPSLVERYARERCISGVIIKPNQIGTLSETCAAIRAAHANGAKTIVSHRSGETDDPLIIHLARAAGVYGVKIGAPLNERISKFDELIRLYE